MDLMQHQFLARSAVQENNFEARLFCSEYFLKFYFVLNKTNYARYGSYYLAVLQNMDGLYPGLKPYLKIKDYQFKLKKDIPCAQQLINEGNRPLTKMPNL